MAIIVTLLFSFSTRVFAWPPTYGAEFELITKELAADLKKKKEGENEFSGKEQAALLKFVEAIKKRCEKMGCKVEPVPGKWEHSSKRVGEAVPDFRVTLNDGWWFQISYDPYCVEIQTKPSTLDELRERKTVINDIIFATASRNGFSAGEKSSSGHFNMGVRSAFNDDPVEFLRFYVDYQNHPELALGTIGINLANAAPLAMLGPKPRAALEKLVALTQKGKGPKTILEMARAIQSNVYTEGYKPEWNAFYHYQAIGLKKIVNSYDNLRVDKPVELRAVDGQQNLDEFILLAELMELRVNFLRDKKPPLTYVPLDYKGKPTKTPRELVSRFYMYVVEAGGDYKKFRDILPNELKTVAPEQFLVGKQDWTGSKSPKAFETYLPLLGTNAFLRERMLAAFSQPESIKKFGPEFLSKIIEAGLDARDPELKKVYADFLRRIFETDTWKSPEAIAKFEEQAKKGGGKLTWGGFKELFPEAMRPFITSRPNFISRCLTALRNLIPLQRLATNP